VRGFCMCEESRRINFENSQTISTAQTRIKGKKKKNSKKIIYITPVFGSL